MELPEVGVTSANPLALTDASRKGQRKARQALQKKEEAAVTTKR